MKDEYKEMVCRVRFIDGVHARTYLSDVEIVRCKDCKWYRGNDCWHKADEGFYQSIIECPSPDDYCSKAKRREE